MRLRLILNKIISKRYAKYKHGNYIDANFKDAFIKK